MDKEKKRVLIIEDEPLNIFALRHALKEDFVISATKTGEEGLATAKEILPDIILLDIVMDGKDGFEVLVDLKNDAATKNIPVIFLTSKSTMVEEEKGLLLGAVDYIHKPFSGEIVKLRIHNQLRLAESKKDLLQLDIRDPLTGLANAIHFNHLIINEWIRAMRGEQPITLIIVHMLNIDDCAEAHGIQNVNLSIKALAAIILKTYNKPNNIIARWSDYELAIVVCGEAEDQRVKDHVDTMRTIIAEFKIAVANKLPLLEINTGVRTAQPTMNDNYTLRNFITDAHRIVQSY